MKKFGVITFGSGQFQTRNMKLRIPETISPNLRHEAGRKPKAQLAARIYMTGFYCMGVLLLLNAFRSGKKS